jgi:Ca2+/H+ antiporter, TMEM165/GDT1 family
VLSVYVPALLVALIITMTEMTEVVAVVFALGAERGTIRHGILGAIAGTAVVGSFALLFGAVLLRLPEHYLLWGSAIVLLAFGVFLFRSTLRSYRRQRSPAPPGPPPSAARTLEFAGGFSVGSIETTEAVIVLLALSAAGYGSSAILGAVAGGAILVVVAVQVHERIRRIKVPQLKLGATSLLFTFAVFWAGEAAGVPWPAGDLFLIPLFFAALLLVRGSIELALGRARMPLQANG